MAFKYKGSVKILGGYDVNTKRPLDNRNVVQSLEDLYNIPYHYSYEGMPVTVIEECTIYVLLNDSKRGSPEGWKKIGNVDINGNNIELQTFIKSEISTYINENELTREEVKEIITNSFN